MSDTTSWEWVDGYDNTTYSDDSIFTVDACTKKIQTITDQTLVAGEDCSQLIMFEMDRYYDAVDLSEKHLQVIFQAENGYTDINSAVCVKRSADRLRFGWVVPGEALTEPGTLAFSIEVVGSNYVWKTRTYEKTIEDGLNGEIIIPEPTERAWYIEIQSQVAAAVENAEAALAKAKAIINGIGSPTTAATAAAMTDTTKVYVYTGSEPNYEYGYWYYHDGTEWHPGGEYASTALYTDRTPTQGSNNAVSSGGVYVLKENLDGLRSHPVLTWNIGKNISTTGSIQENLYMALTKPIPVDGGDVVVRTTPTKDNIGKSLIVYINTYILDVWSERITLAYNESYTIPADVTTIRIGYGRTAASGVTMTHEDADMYFSADFYTFSTFVKQRTQIVGTSFADNAKIGVYNFGGGTPYSTMTDKPTETFGGGCMVVIPAGGNTYNRIQIIYDLVNRIIYRRYLSYNNSTGKYNVGEWSTANIGEWSAFDFAATYTQIRTLNADAALLSANTDTGLYRVGSYAQEPMATYIANGDYPDAKYGGGWMLVLPSGGNNGVCQVVYDVVNGYINSRYISGNSLQNVGAWNAGHGIKWAAIGDSITYGVYSTGANSSAVNRDKCYAKRIANLIGAERFDNLGVRGLGYINTGNNGETLKDDVIDSQDINWTDYNLITVALGVNDYYGNRIIGTQSDEAWSGTVYGSIRGTIESLLAYNPKAKLIFITPFNMAKSGSLSTHWGKGYAKSNVGTLNDVKNAIIYWCDYYGVEYINETDYSVINDISITTLLPDSLHPSADAHALLARELTKKINFS